MVVDAFEDRLARQAGSPMSPGYVIASSILDGSDSLWVVGVCKCWTRLSELRLRATTVGQRNKPNEGEAKQIWVCK